MSEIVVIVCEPNIGWIKTVVNDWNSERSHVNPELMFLSGNGLQPIKSTRRKTGVGLLDMRFSVRFTFDLTHTEEWFAFLNASLTGQGKIQLRTLRRQSLVGLLNFSIAKELRVGTHSLRIQRKQDHAGSLTIQSMHRRQSFRLALSTQPD